MFGGDPDLPVTPIERDLSPIETEAAALVFQQLAHAFNGAGERSLGIRFPVPRPVFGQGLEEPCRARRAGGTHRLYAELRGRPGTVTATIPQRLLVQRRGDGRIGAETALRRSASARR